MIYKNLTAKELYSSIPSMATITYMMGTGINVGSTQLAVSAMEELIRRKSEDLALDVLKTAYEKGDLKPGTSMMSMLISSMAEEHKNDMLLHFAEAIVGANKVKDVETGTLLRSLYYAASRIDVMKPGTAEKHREFICRYLVDDEGNPIPDSDGNGDETPT